MPGRRQEEAADRQRQQYAADGDQRRDAASFLHSAASLKSKVQKRVVTVAHQKRHAHQQYDDDPHRSQSVRQGGGEGLFPLFPQPLGKARAADDGQDQQQPAAPLQVPPLTRRKAKAAQQPTSQWQAPTSRCENGCAPSTA